MIAYPTSLLAVGGAKTGIAPVNLLDVQTPSGDTHFWADRRINAPSALAPVVVPGTTMPWATAGGQNAAYAFGIDDGTPPIVIPVTAGQVIGITALGSSGWFAGDIYGPNGDPGNVTGDTTDSAGYYPTHYMSGSTLGKVGLCGCFADAAGNVLQPLSIGASASVTVPAGAVLLQLGVDDNKFSDNSGSFLVTLAGVSAGVTEAYLPWLLSVPSFSFHRSLQTDTGSFVLQNLSGDTLGRDFEKIARKSALEGSFFVYRCWQPDAAAAWIEVHGTLTMNPAGVDTVELKGAQLLNPSQDDTPLEIYSETCQLEWAGRRCGATGTIECLYSFQTCQVIERPMMVLNNYEKNYGEAAAVTALKMINRRRKF